LAAQLSEGRHFRARSWLLIAFAGVEEISEENGIDVDSGFVGRLRPRTGARGGSRAYSNLYFGEWRYYGASHHCRRYHTSIQPGQNGRAHDDSR
jgi:hypothetical protein